VEGLGKIFPQERAEHQTKQTQLAGLMDLETLADLPLLSVIRIEVLPEEAVRELLEPIKAGPTRVLRVVQEKTMQFQDLPQITQAGEAADHIREVEARLIIRADQRGMIARVLAEGRPRPPPTTAEMGQPTRAVAAAEVVAMEVGWLAMAATEEAEWSSSAI
jgi:hypothetical protein